MTTHNDSWEERLLDLKAVNGSVYFGSVEKPCPGRDTGECCHNEQTYDEALTELKDFIRQTRTQAYTEGVMKAYESVKGELEYIASRNDTHNAVCIPAAERALSAIKALLP